ncbi:26S proteasome non-ATPase regulatory subunit 5-like [Physella acuta]|uniref:26S proteasome non-ATPase regulatory subunit 5-like n=1 Tax=Physella acuta TaxID=109671 RepID=UPI0027DBF59D|nr:26S proteasome non-ATPase regulatory subunit 5-like [Physella acuta]
MAAETTINSLIERLQQISLGDKLDLLDELKTAITALPIHELRQILPNISITSIFQCLNTEDSSQQKVCGEVLDRLLTTLSPSTVLQNFHPQLLTWLRLPDDTLKALCLAQLLKISKEVPGEICIYEDLVQEIVDQLPSDSLDVGPAAASILTFIGQDPNGLRVLFSSPIVSKFVTAMQKNDVTRFRIYQIAVDLSRTSPSALDASVGSGLLQQLVNEIEKHDILVQLNAIDMLSDLAQTTHGLMYLDTQGVVGKLEEMMRGLNDNPLSGLLLPGLIKFFGSLARQHPKEVLFKFDHFVRLVLHNVSEGDPTLKGVSVDTIGFIASTPEGKLALEKLGNPMTECLHGIGNLIRTGTSDLKVRALNALTSITQLQVEHQTVELLALTERWFSSCAPDTFNMVWSITQQPFLDLRIPAFRLLHSVASLPWGQKIINNVPGFKEYVLNRASESSKEGKEEKFELVNILAHSPTAVEILGRPYHVKLMEYFNQGAFYVVAQSEIMMDGE